MQIHKSLFFSQNGFPIPFQSQITFWLLGGEDILFDGGGTVDGSGQVSNFQVLAESKFKKTHISIDLVGHLVSSPQPLPGLELKL